ncbi:MAG: peroxidase-related enzyme [Terracoccus sp.]
MTWITTIDRENAEPRLRDTYDRIAGPHGKIDNILLAHSLRPHTLTGHLALYKAVLHHSRNRLPVSFLETIGVQVSHLNACAYCVDHHSAGLRELLGDDARHGVVLQALRAGRPEDAFEGRELAALRYTRLLTEAPGTVSENDIQTLRATGLDDGEILEINQVAAYFAYANRTVLGLGITTAGDHLGTAPPESDDVTEWRHG